MTTPTPRTTVRLSHAAGSDLGVAVAFWCLRSGTRLVRHADTLDAVVSVLHTRTTRQPRTRLDRVARRVLVDDQRIVPSQLRRISDSVRSFVPEIVG